MCYLPRYLSLDSHKLVTTSTITVELSLKSYVMQVPFTFKYAVDALTLDPTGATTTAMPLLTLLPATVLLGYGAARAGAALCNEARNAVFAKACSACCKSYIHTRALSITLTKPCQDFQTFRSFFGMGVHASQAMPGRIEASSYSPSH